MTIAERDTTVYSIIRSLLTSEHWSCPVSAHRTGVGPLAECWCWHGEIFLPILKTILEPRDQICLSCQKKIHNFFEKIPNALEYGQIKVFTRVPLCQNLWDYLPLSAGAGPGPGVSQSEQGPRLRRRDQYYWGRTGVSWPSCKYCADTACS